MPLVKWFSRSALAALFACSAVSLSAADSCGSGPCAPPSPAPTCGDPGCGENGCGENVSVCGYESLGLESLFSEFSGDRPLLADLQGQKVGGLTYSVGGELRYRHINERNRLRPPVAGMTNYDQWRFTPYVSMSYDRVTGYVQAIEAPTFGVDAPFTDLPIDTNRADLLQAYVDIKIGEIGDGKLSYRYGRQLLKYGGQRLISPLAWSNTFRNFEGHKLVYTDSDWDIDGFAVQSVNGAGGNLFRPVSFDHADQSRRLTGVYATYKGIENNNVDLYWIHFDEDTPSAALMDGSRHTLGMRIAGKQPVKEGKAVVGSWNWDLEGAWQFGEDNFGSAAIRDVNAGMLGALGGYTFESAPLKPGIGGIFYYSSGDNDPTTGDINTFYTMYPLGHAYWGQIDNLSGQNLLNYGVQASVKPHQKVDLVTQWHYFELAQASDRIYNIAGAGLAGGGASKIGNELDIVATYTHSRNLNVQAGYFWFFYGDAVTGGPLARPDARQFYVMTTFTY
ncbi:MAG: alginate export family protein [Planctomycetaceae bacterium]|nr:alginate export family protein [Planctomycetaceae bacterium]